MNILGACGRRLEESAAKASMPLLDGRDFVVCDGGMVNTTGMA
jgi:hypothetical protein